MIKWLSRLMHLSEHVLGINARNIDYIYPNNPRKYFPRVDNKLLTKTILSQKAIPVPKTLLVVRDQSEIPKLNHQLKKLTHFILKPAQGAGGRGILIIHKNENGQFVTPTPSGEALISTEAIEVHIKYILSGIFSLEKISDQAYLEELLEPDPALTFLGATGIPDIRIIFFHGQPVMAMLRLPTIQSRGKANLHQGAIGLGIDMHRGVTTHAVLKNKAITHDPISGKSLLGVMIPFWKKIVDISRQAVAPIGLNYLGVDIIVDKKHGPVVVELNARPGLNIQLANQQGLIKQLVAGGHREL